MEGVSAEIQPFCEVQVSTSTLGEANRSSEQVISTSISNIQIKIEGKILYLCKSFANQIDLLFLKGEDSTVIS